MSALARVACLVLGHRPGVPVQRDTVKVVHPLGGTARPVTRVVTEKQCLRCHAILREETSQDDEMEST